MMLPGAMQPQVKQVQTPFTFLNSHQNKLPDEFLSPRPHGGIRRFLGSASSNERQACDFSSATAAWAMNCSPMRMRRVRYSRWRRFLMTV